MKTTRAHFELFQKECEKWIEVFGLKGWEIYFDHSIINPNNRAECQYNIINRSITLHLNPDWSNDKITPEALRRDAYHEVCEILLCRIRCIAGTRFINKDEIDEEIHVIIRTLENVVFKEG